MNNYSRKTQTSKNLAWFLPRPSKSRYPGSMPLYCEDWLVELARDILKKPCPEILNVFCGKNQYGFRVDINEKVKPDLVADAHHLSEILNKQFDLIIADPPYSTEEAKEIYGTPPLKYKIWTKECEKLLRPGGILIVYHKFVMPNPNPKKFNVEKRVFIGNRTLHLPRVAIYFKKKITDEQEEVQLKTNYIFDEKEGE